MNSEYVDDYVLCISRTFLVHFQKHLKEKDIPVVKSLPVGQSLQDHLFLGVTYGTKPDVDNGVRASLNVAPCDASSFVIVREIKYPLVLQFTDKSTLDVSKMLFDNFVTGSGIGQWPYIHAMSFFRTGVQEEVLFSFSMCVFPPV